MYCVGVYCDVLCCHLLYCIVLYCIVLYCHVLYCIVLSCIVLYCKYCIALRWVVLCCTVTCCSSMCFLLSPSQCFLHVDAILLNIDSAAFKMYYRQEFLSSQVQLQLQATELLRCRIHDRMALPTREGTQRLPRKGPLHAKTWRRPCISPSEEAPQSIELLLPSRLGS